MEVLPNVDNLLDFVKKLGVGRRPLDDPFFENSHKYCKVLERKGVTIEDDERLCHEMMGEFTCNACNATFQNLLDYELHYHNCHHYVCAKCNKWRPTARLLDIHVQETHDNFFQVLAERQPMYQCFVSECEEKFKDPAERRKHCLEVHEFPKNYRYDNSKCAKATRESEKNEEMETDAPETSKKTKSIIQFGNNHKQKTFTKSMANVKVKESTSAPEGDVKPKITMAPVTMFIPRQVQRKLNEEKQINMMELEESLSKIA
ncbi:zinc finger protein 511 [Copidosoma floridanum]|uniref:zinc finger protein 511 n=1 Tax=Copidosoma floridanum TaxID=29053 RepID=UPI0006C9B0A7|nr:zinc finger protein 511 [Copidosoma floridanum]